MAIEQVHAQKVAELSFAHGKVGEGYQLELPAAEQEHALELASHTHELTKANTADCGDERPTISFADGLNDPEGIKGRVVPQLFGGLGLSATKALVAADALVVRDTKSMWEAYQLTSKLLRDEFGYEDAGHDGCGASASVETSVAKPIEHDILVPSIALFMPSIENLDSILTKNSHTKQARLESGFYSDWDPAKHKEYLIQNFPQNFAHLLVDPTDDETFGHQGSSVYVISSPNRGFAKNEFVEDTGQQAFCVTTAIMSDLARKFAGSEEERLRIEAAFVDDTLHVGKGIVIKGMPVFAETA